MAASPLSEGYQEGPQREKTSAGLLSLTLHEVLAVSAGLSRAILWGVVGAAFGGWAALVAFLIGGSLGMVIGFAGTDWLTSTPPANRLWMLVEIAGTLVGLGLFIGLPIWALLRVRAG